VGEWSPKAWLYLSQGADLSRIIAIMLGRLEMDVDECIATYRDLIGKIFKSKVSKTGFSLTGSIKAHFSSAVLEEAIIKVIKDRSGFSENDLLDDGYERACRVLVCAVAKETKHVARLKSYTNEGESKPSVSPKIWQAALATSAATSFFDPVEIGARTFVDGALHVNNPVEEIEQEACDIWCPVTAELKKEISCFVSIGTGNPGKTPIASGVFKFLSKTLVSIATETEITANRFGNSWRSLLNKRYFRLNVEQGLQKVALEAYGEEGTVEAATEEYLNEAGQVIKLKAIADILRWKESACVVDWT
jgi:predicted acylesterase/phospholipase RssA